MRKKFLSSCMMALLGITTLGLASCSSDDNVIAAQNDVASGHYSPEGASYISLSAEKGQQTRSTLSESGDYLNFQWKTGDELLVVVTGYGAIGTIKATADGNAPTDGGSSTTTFSGTVKGTLDASDHLRFYYLGNKDVDFGAKEITCDFSTQAGTLKSAASLRYFASDEVSLTKSGTNWILPDNLTLSTKITVLKFNITYTDADSKSYNASSVIVNGTGIINCATINLLKGTFTSGQTVGPMGTITSISMSHTQAQSSPCYYMAIPVFGESTTISNPNMSCTFFDESSTRQMQSWTSWTISQGCWYAGTDGTGMSIPFSSTDVGTSNKSGYSGVDILGGTNNTNYSTKGGYSGNPVDGQVDDPVVTKGGYTGTDVH